MLGFKIIRVAPRIGGDLAVVKPRPLLGEGDAFMLRDKKKMRQYLYFCTSKARSEYLAVVLLELVQGTEDGGAVVASQARKLVKQVN